MKLQKTRPVYDEVALSGEEDFGRRGRGGSRRRPHGRPPLPREHADDLPPLEDGEMSGRAERQARRKLRRKQRGARKGLRASQKLQKLQEKAGVSRSGSRADRRGGQSARAPERTSAPLDRGFNQRAPEQLDELPVEEEWDEADEEWDDSEEWDEADELEEEFLEGTYAELGAAIDVGRISRGDARRIFSRVKQNIQAKRDRIKARRSGQPAPAAAPSPAASNGWGPVAKMGPNLRIQAGNGHRAAVMELRPGLYLVADVKNQAVLPATEGGIGAVLPLLMAKGAVKAIQKGVQNRRANGGRLWQRERNNPVLNPPQQPHLSPASPPLLLAGPVAENIGHCCTWAREEDW